jgi:hypothetical protein
MSLAVAFVLIPGMAKGEQDVFLNAMVNASPLR